MKHSDEKLVTDYFKGEEKALENLIKRYIKPIYGFVYANIGNKEDAEDITQDIFLRTWRSLKRFDKNKSFKSWIFSIAKNACVDWSRKKRAIPFSRFDDGNGENFLIKKLVDPYSFMDDLVVKMDVFGMVTAAKNALLPEYRKILSLRYDNYLNFREMAEILGEPINTVKSRHRRALLQLRKKMR